MEACLYPRATQMPPRLQTCVLAERSRKLTRPCCGNYSTTIPPVPVAWYYMRSQKRRSRLRSLFVTSIGCGKSGGSIEEKGGRAEWTVKKTRVAKLAGGSLLQASRDTMLDR